jgi:hypothetical protein
LNLLLIKLLYNLTLLFLPRLMTDFWISFKSLKINWFEKITFNYLFLS